MDEEEKKEGKIKGQEILDTKLGWFLNLGLGDCHDPESGALRIPCCDYVVSIFHMHKSDK